MSDTGIDSAGDPPRSICIECNYQGEKFLLFPGKILVIEIPKGSQMSAGGIALPNTNENKNHRFGEVIGCGMYRDYHGRALFNTRLTDDIPWPIPQGTLLEHEMTSGTETVANGKVQIAINTHFVIRGWLPGHWPKWAVDSKDNMARGTRR